METANLPLDTADADRAALATLLGPDLPQTDRDRRRLVVRPDTGRPACAGRLCADGDPADRLCGLRDRSPHRRQLARGGFLGGSGLRVGRQRALHGQVIRAKRPPTVCALRSAGAGRRADRVVAGRFRGRDHRERKLRGTSRRQHPLLLLLPARLRRRDDAPAASGQALQPRVVARRDHRRSRCGRAVRRIPVPQRPARCGRGPGRGRDQPGVPDRGPAAARIGDRRNRRDPRTAPAAVDAGGRRASPSTPSGTPPTYLPPESARRTSA